MRLLTPRARRAHSARSFATATTLALLTALAVLAASTADARADFLTFQSFGPSPASITPTRDAFRTAVGPSNTTTINWDAVPDTLADPNLLPGNFFNTTAPRGVLLSTPGTGFLVSSTPGQPNTTPLFGFQSDLQPFSPNRLFVAQNSNITDVTFRVPGTDTPATTSAFAAVFTDAEIRDASRLQFFDLAGTLIFDQSVPISNNQALEFLGAVANNGEQIARVRITAGANALVSDGTLADPTFDFVALDDFLFATPTATPDAPAAPAPSPATATAAALTTLAALRLRRPNNRTRRTEPR